MPITNADGELVYEAIGEFSLFINPTWRLMSADSEVATIRRKIFSWSPTWLISGELGDFIIRRKIWSWVRKYQVIGGPFDNAELIGNFWGLKFKITYQSKEIAHAQGKILTLRNTHNIEVLANDPKTTLFVAIAMTVLQMDKKDDQNNQNHSD